MTLKRYETKLLDLATTTVKAIADDGTFEGWVSKYNNIDSYGDRIMPGAYSETLKSGEPISMYFNHQYRQPGAPARIGIWDAFEEREEGLWGKGRLTLGHPMVPGILAAMRNGSLSGLSIGYTVPPNGSRMIDGVRELIAIRLHETSIVDDPADDFARISLDSVKSMRTVREAEGFLRDAGFSGTEAKAFLSGLKGILSREKEEATDPTAALVAELNRIYAQKV